MFRDCAELERNVFVTWEEDDVNEQDVDERKEYWERKKMLSHIWVISESNLTSSLISSNHYAEHSLAFTANWLELQSWYARNITSILIQISIQKTNHLFKSHWRDRNYIFVQTRWNSIEKKLLWKVISNWCSSHLSELIFQSSFFNRQWFSCLHNHTF